MKVRSQLVGAEVAALRETLARRLEGIGISSQPEVALKILELSRDPKSELRDYAAVIRTDAGLSGRLLRLANCALFAQRREVTSLDRACLLLGVERLRSLALGFHLSRAAVDDRSAGVSRRVWSQSLFRAFLSSELAKRLVPTLSPEAFVVGLMMDSGLALMPRLAGAAFDQHWSGDPSPAMLFDLERGTLGFTHVDVAAALAERWRLPELIARPIEWHHTPCATGIRPEPVHRLHRIAYAVGTLDLRSKGARAHPRAGSSHATLRECLALDEVEMSEVLAASAREHAACVEVFGEIADGWPVDVAMLDRIAAAVIEFQDDQALGALCGDGGESSRRFAIAGRHVEIQRTSGRQLVAYLYDAQGKRLVSHAIRGRHESAESLLEALGVEARPGERHDDLSEYLRRQAA